MNVVGHHLGSFSSVQSLRCVWLFATPWIVACQASLSITNSQSLPKLMSIVSVMSSNHLILCHPLLFLPSIFPSIKVFSKEWILCIRWPKSWSFSISPSNEYSGLIFSQQENGDLNTTSQAITLAYNLNESGRGHWAPNEKTALTETSKRNQTPTIGMNHYRGGDL